MTKEEFFEKNLKNIATSVDNKMVSCYKIPCGKCIYYDTEHGNSECHKLENDFKSYQRKKKLKQLLDS